MSLIVFDLKIFSDVTIPYTNLFSATILLNILSVLIIPFKNTDTCLINNLLFKLIIIEDLSVPASVLAVLVY